MSLIDPCRTTCLCDAGLPDYLAVTAVNSDGSTVILLAERDSIGDPEVRFDSACPAAPHEQVGPLPPRWQARVALTPFYCGRTTRAGTRCRIPVSHAGQACGWHRPQTSADPRRQKGKP